MVARMQGRSPGHSLARGLRTTGTPGSLATSLARAIFRGLLPAYLTMAALSSSNWQDQVGWLRYWVAVAAVSLLELVLPARLSRLPPLLYLWCLVPGSCSGTRIIFALVFRTYELQQEKLGQATVWASQVYEEQSAWVQTILTSATDSVQPFVFFVFFMAQSVGSLLSLAMSLDPLPILLLVLAVIYLVWRTGEDHKKRVKPRPGRGALTSISPPERAEEEEEGVLALPDNDNVNFTKQMTAKSKKIVMDAEHGEAKSAIDRCKKFLNGVESSSFSCKIFINSWEDIEGVKNFERIVSNVGAQLRLPKEDIEGLKLCGTGGRSKRDYLAFECAMKEEGQVRLHTGGYSVCRKEGDLLDFQILHHSIDMAHVTLKQLPEDAERQLVSSNWFRGEGGGQRPSEGRDWNVYFQYEAHKNLLKELPEEVEE